MPESPSSNPELADLIIERLNMLVEYHPNVKADLEQFIEQRFKVAPQTGMHPTIQCGGDFDGSTAGFLGWLNGLCGVVEEGHPLGWGFIAAVYESQQDGSRVLVRFARTDKAETP